MTDERTKWQKIKLEGEGERQIYLEVIDQVEVIDQGDIKEVGILDSIPFEQVTEILEVIAQTIGNTLEKAKPTKASVELGVEFSVENGQVVGLIARGSAKANLKITLEWERSEPKIASSGQGHE